MQTICLIFVRGNWYNYKIVCGDRNVENPTRCRQNLTTEPSRALCLKLRATDSLIDTSVWETLH